MQQDVIIVGAGIIGLATAERLLKQGIKVLLLERGQVGKESSWAGGGILSPLMPWHYSETVTRLTQYSASLFSDWASTLHTATSIDPEYNQCGLFILPPYNLETAIHWCSKNETNIQQIRLPVPYSTNMTHINRKKIEQTIYLPEIAQIRNPRLLRALRQHVIQLGGQIVENCTVHGITIKQNKVQFLFSSCGRFVADNFIIAAGAWTKEVLGRYALGLDIRPICGQMLLFKFDTLPLQALLVKNGTYIIPRKDGHLLVGSTLEDKGFSKQITITARNKLLRDAITVLPQLHNMPIKNHWSGLRPASPQNIPTIGQHPDLANLYINSGHFRYGVTMAPASAKILVNEILGIAQPFDVTPYKAGWHEKEHFSHLCIS
ncbi:MAG: glycine oxidase ThiO [Burkholderiales bacterium]|nr:glycine oxidase ThiO [Nitrosomonas sp.]MCP5274424.1 glycine oxidase ThiO [Burkholderiales bacterium]